MKKQETMKLIIRSEYVNFKEYLLNKLSELRVKNSSYTGEANKASASHGKEHAILGGVSGFKIDRINKMKELFEKGLIRFDQKAAKKN